MYANVAGCAIKICAPPIFSLSCCSTTWSLSRITIYRAFYTRCGLLKKWSVSCAQHTTAVYMLKLWRTKVHAPLRTTPTSNDSHDQPVTRFVCTHTQFMRQETRIEREGDREKKRLRKTNQVREGDLIPRHTNAINRICWFSNEIFLFLSVRFVFFAMRTFFCLNFFVELWWIGM